MLCTQCDVLIPLHLLLYHSLCLYVSVSHHSGNKQFIPANMAVRSGCVVVSFGLEREDATKPQNIDQTLRLLQKEVRMWAEEYGLLDESQIDDLAKEAVSVQVCALVQDAVGSASIVTCA